MTVAFPPVMPDQLAVLVGIETAYGTLPAGATATRVTDLRMGGLRASTTVPEIGIAGSVGPREPFRQAADLREPVVGLSALFDIENFDWMLLPFFGQPTITAGTALDSSFSQRLFRGSATGAVNSLSVRGAIGGDAWTANGLVGDSLDIPLGKSGGLRAITASYMASDVARGVSWAPTPITQPRPSYHVPGWSTILRINGSAFTVVDGNLTIAAGAERSPDSNNRDVSTPRPGRITASLTGSVELASQAQMDILTRAIAGNADAIQIEMWPDATNRRRVIIDLPYMRIMAPELSVSAAATRVPVSLTATAERDPAGAASALAISVWRSAT